MQLGESQHPFIEGERFQLDSKEFAYCTQSVPDELEKFKMAGVRKAILVRKFFEGVPWLLVEEVPIYGLPEATWLKHAINEPGSLVALSD